MEQVLPRLVHGSVILAEERHRRLFEGSCTSTTERTALMDLDRHKGTDNE